MSGYNFEWEQIGDINLGRPNLGITTNLIVYRLMLYSLRSVLEKDLSYEQTRNILVKAGYIAGQEFCKHILDTSLPLNKFLVQIQEKLLELSIGIFKVEKADQESSSFIVTVSEDLDCSGLPFKGNTVCNIDEGFLGGIFNVYTHKEFVVKEIDCWSTGAKTCRFTIDVKETKQ